MSEPLLYTSPVENYLDQIGQWLVMTASRMPARHTRSRPGHEGDKMKLSARNQIKGKIVGLTKGTTTSHVRIDIGHGVIFTSSITNEAVADLGLKNGDEAWAVIKSSDIMIGK